MTKLKMKQKIKFRWISAVSVEKNFLFFAVWMYFDHYKPY